MNSYRMSKMLNESDSYSISEKKIFAKFFYEQIQQCVTKNEETSLISRILFHIFTKEYIDHFDIAIYFHYIEILLERDEYSHLKQYFS